MGKQSNLKLVGFLPLALVATFLVVVAPMLLVMWLRRSGVVTSVWAGPAIGVAVSLLVSYAGGAFWKTRANSQGILFSDLMLWGWVQRWRSERRLTAAADLLGLTTGRPKAISGGQLTNEQKAGLLTQLTSTLEARDAYTHGHSRRVARYASNIAKRMGLSRKDVAKIRAAGAMHDVGKVETPLAVLRKEGKLTAYEYGIIKRHPVDGAAMVSTLHDDDLTAMVRHHHERLDGTGYPDRLAGESIPIGARILAVADTFDAITSTRPYRHANPHRKALDILAADAGTRLDPDAVRAFCRHYSGRRPLAYWTILANARPRLATWLGAGLAPAKAATVGNVMAAAAAATALGGMLAGSAADAGALLSSSKPRTQPQALTRNAPEKPPKAARRQSPGRRAVKDGRPEKARSSRGRSGGEPQPFGQARADSPLQRAAPAQNPAQPRDTAEGRNGGRPQSAGRAHTAQPRDTAEGRNGGRPQSGGTIQYTAPPGDNDQAPANAPTEGNGPGVKPPKEGKRPKVKTPKGGNRPGVEPPKGGTRPKGKPPKGGNPPAVKPPKEGNGRGPRRGARRATQSTERTEMFLPALLYAGAATTSSARTRATAESAGAVEKTSPEGMGATIGLYASGSEPGLRWP